MWNLAEDTISTEDVDALADWLRTHPRLTQGDRVCEFERLWSRWLGVRHSVMMTSGTTANLALVSVAARRVDRTPPRVGVAAVTWPTNVTPSLLLGHDVVVFDVDRSTLGVNESHVCEAIERREVDIVFVTHLLGLNALTDRVLETADKNGVILLEDCCEAHGTRHDDRKVGTLGLGSTFSFYFGHHMSTIEGGIVSTNDAEVADDLRLMRAHGLARESVAFDELRALHPDIDARFLFTSIGLNFRPTEINAFLGIRQLEDLDQRIEHRNRNLAQFLRDAPDWLWKDFRTEGMSSFALPLIARDTRGASVIAAVVERLGIEARPVVAGNLLRQPFMRQERVRVHGGYAPVADQIHERGLYVGNGHHVDSAKVRQLTSALSSEGASV